MEINELLYRINDIWIPSGELAPNYKAYIAKYSKAPSDIKIITRIMRSIQASSEELIQLWWQTVRKSFMWITQMREPSTDIDLYARNIKVIEWLAKYASDNWYQILYNPSHEYFYMECEWVPISIAFESIKWVVPEELNTHRVSWVKMIKPAELIAMKLRRVWEDWEYRYRPKDINDYAHLLLSSNISKRSIQSIEFDVNQHNLFSQKIWSPWIQSISHARLSRALWLTARWYIGKEAVQLIKLFHKHNLSE